MKLGLVIGTVVSARTAGNMNGKKLLLVRDLNAEYRPSPVTAVCVDTVGAGAGQVVLVVGSSSARLPEGAKGSATDTAIIAIVDAQVAEA